MGLATHTHSDTHMCACTHTCVRAHTCTYGAHHYHVSSMADLNGKTLVLYFYSIHYTANAVVPVSVHIVMLGIVMFIMGMMIGALVNGKIFSWSIAHVRIDTLQLVHGFVFAVVLNGVILLLKVFMLF